MRTMLLALVASSTLAAAAPVLAHDHDGDWDGWGRAPAYEIFQRQVRHISQGIERGLSDGAYTPREANYFYGQLRSIQKDADWHARRGDYDPGDIQEQLQQLRERMHIVEERHERLENDWNGRRYGYGYRSYQPYWGDDRYDDRR